MSEQTKPRRPRLPKGTVLDGRFEIEELLGAGSFGAVYRARQMVFGHALRQVALKLFATDVTAANMHEVFRDAVMLLALQEQSPDLEVARRMVQVYDIGLLQTPEPCAFLSMKLVPGRKNLETAVRRWRNARIPLATSLMLVRQLLIPLAWMHGLDVPVVHGDLKPDNVLLSEDGATVILTDFGLAAHMPLGSQGGAIAYQAPESLLGLKADPAADVYAVGLIWYELLTGRQPFDDVGLEATAAGDDRGYVRAHAEARKWPIRAAEPGDGPGTRRIAPASETHPELREHPQLETVLRRCLAYRQADRYANARLLLDDLDRYRDTGTVTGLDAVAAAPARVPEKEPAAVLKEKTAELLVADALALLHAGRTADAIACTEAALRKDARCFRAWLAQARVRIALKAENELHRARECCEKAQALAPDEPEPLGVLAEVLRALNKPTLAQKAQEQERELRARKNRQGRK